MVGVVALAAVVIMAVLLFTSRSYFEVVIFLIVFSVAALLNMGTNFWLGEISSITNSIAVILQLALAIDYAIIFSHRYQDEIDRFPTEREALIEALSKSIVEISSSSLTTISGLVALMLMQFRLGYDLGLVLSKGILCSLITVFLLMPGLIASFFRPLRRTTHKSHVPDITGWGRFLMKTRVGFVALFVIIVPLAIWCSSRSGICLQRRRASMNLKYSREPARRRGSHRHLCERHDDRRARSERKLRSGKAVPARRRGARQCEDRHWACEYRDRGRESVDGFLYAAHVLHAAEYRF